MVIAAREAPKVPYQPRFGRCVLVLPAPYESVTCLPGTFCSSQGKKSKSFQKTLETALALK
jgi:hypothetical protein